MRRLALTVMVLALGGSAYAKETAREPWVDACAARLKPLERGGFTEGALDIRLSVEADQVSLEIMPGEFLLYRATAYRKIGSRPASEEVGEKPAPKFKDSAWHTYHMEPPPHERDIRVTEFKQQAGLEAFIFMHVDSNTPAKARRDVEQFQSAARSALEACLESR